ncbi:hypothetical protein QBC47DRAFT_398989 [Echria macrotheca]|uniref:Uncharacterized protein n=1 Tax=Echria macrotheca TaxID=438768 RepID=A0AAJ0FEE8_9PEZI|nr:hypothetical protein QBC47DRAFT_398989 [Echria macrotheca]
MKLLAILTILATAVTAAPASTSWDPWVDVYPAPCGRSVPSGRCSSEKTCTEKGGFFVQRDCDFYNVGDVGCCYQS